MRFFRPICYGNQNQNILLLVVSVLALAQLNVSQAQHSPIDFLKHHNAARAEVGVKPLIWNTTLEEYAKKFGELRWKDCKCSYSKGPYSENIYMGQGDDSGDTEAPAAVKSWVDGKAEYDYNTNTCINGTDWCTNYTQVVWKNSLHVGCAYTGCSDYDDTVYISCNYDPPGNIFGQRPY